MREYALIMMNMINYASLYQKKQSAEYKRRQTFKHLNMSNIKMERFAKGKG